MLRKPIVLAISLLSSMALAQNARPVLEENPQEFFAESEELPQDFAEIHRALDAETFRRTQKHLFEQPFEIDLRENEARVKVRNPKTGKMEQIRVARSGGSCC